jgi:hypothetical protein
MRRNPAASPALAGPTGDGKITSCVRRSKTLKRVFALDRHRRSPREVGVRLR